MYKILNQNYIVEQHLAINHSEIIIINMYNK